jgi:hypothetical protein
VPAQHDLVHVDAVACDVIFVIAGHKYHVRRAKSVLHQTCRDRRSCFGEKEGEVVLRRSAAENEQA